MKGGRRKRTGVLWCHFCDAPRPSIFTKPESAAEVTRGLVERVEGVIVQRVQFLFGMMGKFWKQTVVMAAHHWT